MASESIFCAYCGALISSEVIKRRHKTQEQIREQQICCTREEDILRRKRDGLYKAMSLKGREGRRAFLKQTKPKRKHSEETNRKISASLKRRYSEKKP